MGNVVGAREIKVKEIKAQKKGPYLSMTELPSYTLTMLGRTVDL